MAKKKEAKQAKVVEVVIFEDANSEDAIVIDDRAAYDRKAARMLREKGSAVIGLDRSLLGTPKLFDVPEAPEDEEPPE